MRAIYLIIWPRCRYNVKLTCSFLIYFVFYNPLLLLVGSKFLKETLSNKMSDRGCENVKRAIYYLSRYKMSFSRYSDRCIISCVNANIKNCKCRM